MHKSTLESEMKAHSKLILLKFKLSPFKNDSIEIDSFEFETLEVYVFKAITVRGRFFVCLETSSFPPRKKLLDGFLYTLCLVGIELATG